MAGLLIVGYLVHSGFFFFFWVQNLFSKGPQGFEDYGSEGSEQ
jgi:hypothetical protein